jgi:hypothetical protein
MIADIQEKYQQLSARQKQIFAGYGLRQIKHFVEMSLPKLEAALPAGAQVQGINSEGKAQAIDLKTQQTLLWISDQQWQARPVLKGEIDLKEDFLAVWQIFNLSAYDLIDLSHIHRDFLSAQQV